jgi:hypothetical protein
MFPYKKPKKDDDGKVIIGPRNFFTRKMRKGKTDGVYFGRP